MGTALSNGLDEDGFFKWIEWGRLFRLGWMRTAFSAVLNEDGFFDWVEWERLFRLDWMRTAFSYELNENDSLIWVEWGRLFHMGWMGTAFLIGGAPQTKAIPMVSSNGRGTRQCHDEVMYLYL
jgi:hypothetical protein